MKRRWTLTLAAMAVVFSGCTTTSTPTEHVAVPGADRGVVRNNKTQPQWSVDMVKGKDENNFYFVSVVEKSFKLNMGVDKAKTDALGHVAQQIGADIVKSVSAAATGDVSVAGGAQESFDTATGALSKTSIAGAAVEDIYWEEIRGKQGEENYYSISVLVSVPRVEVARASKIWLEKFNKTKAAQALKEDVKKKVEAYNAETEGAGGGGDSI